MNSHPILKTLIVCFGLSVPSCGEPGDTTPEREVAKPAALQPASGSDSKRETVPSTPGETTPDAKASAPSAPATAPTVASSTAPADTKLAPLPIRLPKPLFVGTPRNLRKMNLEKPRRGPRPPFLAPAGVKNLAFEKPVSGSDEEPIIGELDFVTDGEKSGADGTYVDLTFGTQYVQIDLEQECEIHAILLWHFHQEGRVYHDVVVQVAGDEDFISNVKTLYNNDDDNSSGQGVGKDLPYLETYEGKLIDARGVKARYVRLYSRGNTSNDQNHYVEVEVYGRPAR
jgi:hypothetical protein